jgi:Zn-dependent protease with chaperone function
MNVAQKLSPNRSQRWYKARIVGALAVSRKNRVYFDSQPFETLTDAQRLAVAAHELVHIHQGDFAHARTRIVIPTFVASAIILAIFFWLVYSRTPQYIIESDPDGLVILPLIPAALAFWLFGMFFQLLQGSWRRKAELRCDTITATYTDRNALIEALRVQDTLLTPKQKRSFRYRLTKRLRPYPSLQEREDAIRKVMDNRGNAGSLIT